MTKVSIENPCTERAEADGRDDEKRFLNRTREVELEKSKRSQQLLSDRMCEEAFRSGAANQGDEEGLSASSRKIAPNKQKKKS